MIPSIKNCIDEANRANEDGGDGVNAPRTSIPDSELVELSEVRRIEHVRRAREKHNAKLAEVVTARIQVEEIPLDESRPFGLPEGMAPIDIWNMILEHIQDPDDIVRIGETCDLFRDLLKPKYIALKMVEVAPIIPGTLNVLNLRRVCRSSKIVVDQLFQKDTRGYAWWDCELDYWNEEKIQKPFLLVSTMTNPNWFERFLKIVTSVEIQKVPYDCFPFRMIDYCENEQDIGQPNLVAQRTQFKRLLEFVGSSIRKFHFYCIEDNLGSYNLLRGWVALMPNLVELKVEVDWEPFPPPDFDAQALELQPFPTCPKLKRYTFVEIGFAPVFVAEIIRANPTISDVKLWYYEPRGLEEWKRQEFPSILHTLDTSEAAISKFNFYGIWGLPPLHFLQTGLNWPLRELSFTDHQGHRNEPVSSRTIFRFVNSFSKTLEELTITWKVMDSGGYLDLPKVTKLLWKIWPEFMSMDFMVALDNLRDLDLDLTACDEANGSFENARTYVEGKNLPPLFPAMRKIRANARMQEGMIVDGLPFFPEWRIVWRS